MNSLMQSQSHHQICFISSQYREHKNFIDWVNLLEGGERRDNEAKIIIYVCIAEQKQSSLYGHGLVIQSVNPTGLE